MKNLYQWVEDDATLNDPDAKKVHQAWFDIYGQEDFKAQWEGAKGTEEDGGDNFTRTMPNGVKVTMACDGWYIHKEGQSGHPANGCDYWDDQSASLMAKKCGCGYFNQSKEESQE